MTLREYGRAIYDHPAVPDGIAYRSKHHDDEICIALFDHARDRNAPADNPKPMMMEIDELAEFCALYGLGIR